MLSWIWDHVFPPFDAWWPNIVASLVWGLPASAHVISSRRSRAALHAKIDALHAHLKVGQDG